MAHLCVDNLVVHVTDHIARVPLLKPQQCLWCRHGRIRTSAHRDGTGDVKELPLSRVLPEECDFAGCDVIDAAVDLQLTLPHCFLDDSAPPQDLLHAVVHVQLDGVLDLLGRGGPLRCLQRLQGGGPDMPDNGSQVAAEMISRCDAILGAPHGGRDRTALCVAQDHDDRTFQMLNPIFSAPDDPADRGAANVPGDADDKQVAR
mmetsp:Transcript_58824/g.153033  ORF Transcript_58824/g.153033 Transcript_58824/m.153033 type:complete len:203 (-) Transcript_58824:352-960(-)